MRCLFVAKGIYCVVMVCMGSDRISFLGIKSQAFQCLRKNNECKRPIEDLASFILSRYRWQWIIIRSLTFEGGVCVVSCISRLWIFTDGVIYTCYRFADRTFVRIASLPDFNLRSHYRLEFKYPFYAVSDRPGNIRNRFLTIFYRETMLQFFSQLFFSSKNKSEIFSSYLQEKSIFPLENYIKETCFS